MDVLIRSFRDIRRLEAFLAGAGWNAEFRMLTPQGGSFEGCAGIAPGQGIAWFHGLDCETWEVAGTPPSPERSLLVTAPEAFVSAGHQAGACEPRHLLQLPVRTGFRLIGHASPLSVLLIPRTDRPLMEILDPVRRLVNDGEPIRTGTIRAILAAFGEGEIIHQPCGDGALRFGLVRRTCDFIDRHLADSLTMTDLASAQSVSVRTLERAFRDILGSSPSRYLHARRLNAAFRKLGEGRPGHGTVTDAALESGLHHLGRFSGHYREWFGESPGQTLRRSSG